MNNKDKSSMMMKIMGATLAVCSMSAFMGATKANSCPAKKTIKKTAEKAINFMDTVTSLM